MRYESRRDGIWSTVHPELNLTTEQDKRLVPILPLIADFYDSLFGDEIDKLPAKLQRIGDVLIPHAESLDTAIAIGEFIQIGTSAEVHKDQYWSYGVKIPATVERASQAFNIRKTDVWNGGGVCVQVGMERDKQRDLLISLARVYGNARVTAYVQGEKDPQIILSFNKATWRKDDWKPLNEDI